MGANKSVKFFEDHRTLMGGVTPYLSTYEIGGDYNDGWLPTLDTNLLVTEKNRTWYKYYEKPTTTNSTTMAENSKVQVLANDLVRRLLNTMEELPASYRAAVIDQYAGRLLTSGYGYEQTVSILTSGAKGYVAKVARRRLGGRRRIHMTAEESASVRMKKKLLGKSSWYKDKKGGKEQNPKLKGSNGTRKTTSQGAGSNVLKTRAVLFVDQSPMGELARRIREQVNNMGPSLGFKLLIRLFNQSLFYLRRHRACW